jgi:N-acetylneuraminic acid mutarotase
MRRLGPFVLGAVLLLGAKDMCATSDVLHWSLSTPMPETRSDYVAGVVGGKLIVAGGTYWTGSKGHWIKKHFSPSTHAFDPESQTWEKLPDLPVPLGCAGAAVIGGKLYVVGGYTGSQVNRRIFVLEERQGVYAWKDAGEFPFDRVYPRVVAAGSSLYAVGGTTRFEPRDPTGTCCSSKTATRTLLALDTNQMEKGWRQLAPFPGALRFYFSAETDGHAIWMFSGIYQDGPTAPITTYDDVCRYDLTGGKWENEQKLPQVSQATNPPSPVFVGDAIVLINDFQKVWKLDTSKRTYSELAPLPHAAALDRFVWLDHMIVGASGENFIEPPRRRSEWVFIGKFDR